jgi:hypothetical protein
MAFNSRPWEVSLEQYKALEAELDDGMSKEERDQLVKLSIRITKRLRCEKRYGHVVAFLYRSWAHEQGLEATTAWWAEYDAWQARQVEEEKFESPQHDVDVNDGCINGELDF